LYPYGWTRTGKTTLGLIVLIIWRQPHDSTHKMSFSKLDTEARFGNVISQTTFPKVANEVGTLGDERHRGLLEMFKNAIETRIARGKYFQKVNYADIPSLSPCVLTGNPKPPSDSGFQSRIIPIVFTKGDKHSEDERQKFVSFFIKEVVPNLGVLEDFTTNYVMQHPDILLKANKEDCDPIEFGTTILKEFYKAADRDLPDWIDLFVEEPQQVLEDNIDYTRLQVRSFFINTINEAYQKYFRVLDPTDAGIHKKSVLERLNVVCDHNLISFLNLTNSGTTIVILGDIVKELHSQKGGVLQSEIASMHELAHTMGLEYGQKWIGGKNTKVVFGDFSKFADFIDSEISDHNPSAVIQ
jgi:hypothetical protein